MKQFYFYSMQENSTQPVLKDKTGMLSADYNALQARRDKDIASDRSVENPNCYIISHVEPNPDAIRSVEAAVNNPFRTCEKFNGSALILIDYDVRIGPDALHPASETMSPLPAEKELLRREQELKPLRSAAQNTPVYSKSMLNLAAEDTRESFAICYMGAPHNHPSLQYAIDMMATRLDTAASVSSFIKHYDIEYKKIRIDNPHAGPNGCAMMAAAKTASDFQKTQSGRDLTLQVVYARMANDYKEASSHAWKSDLELRNRTATLAKNQAFECLRNNGQYLDAGKRMGFINAVNDKLADSAWNGWNVDSVPKANAQKVIQEVARELADKTDDTRAAFCFRNIADSAEQAANDIVNQAADGRDETVISDGEAR